MKFDLDIDRKTVTLIAAALCAVVLSFLLISPLWRKAGAKTEEVRALDSELAAIRDALQKGNQLDLDKTFVTRDEVSIAINEITDLGASLNISFLLTSPQKIQKKEKADLPVLPIRLEIQSTYEDLGAFLGSLEKLKKSVVTVSDFTIDRREGILPAVYTNLNLEIHLKEGQGG